MFWVALRRTVVLAVRTAVAAALIGLRGDLDFAIVAVACGVDRMKAVREIRLTLLVALPLKRSSR